MITKQQTDSYVLDEIDKKIISATQAGMPLTRYPYHEIAKQIGVDVKLIIIRMKSMSNAGVIRRTGIVPNHYKLGFKANGMSVWEVDADKIIMLGNEIGALEFVSHCYQRPQFLPEWPYNLFAMVHGKSRQEVYNKVKNIEVLLAEHCKSHQVIFSSRILKKTGLRT